MISSAVTTADEESTRFVANEIRQRRNTMTSTVVLPVSMIVEVHDEQCSEEQSPNDDDKSTTSTVSTALSMSSVSSIPIATTVTLSPTVLFCNLKRYFCCASGCAIEDEEDGDEYYEYDDHNSLVSSLVDPDPKEEDEVTSRHDDNPFTTTAIVDGHEIHTKPDQKEGLESQNSPLSVVIDFDKNVKLDSITKARTSLDMSDEGPGDKQDLHFNHDCTQPQTDIQDTTVLTEQLQAETPATKEQDLQVSVGCSEIPKGEIFQLRRHLHEVEVDHCCNMGDTLLERNDITGSSTWYHKCLDVRWNDPDDDGSKRDPHVDVILDNISQLEVQMPQIEPVGSEDDEEDYDSEFLVECRQHILDLQVEIDRIDSLFVEAPTILDEALQAITDAFYDSEGDVDFVSGGDSLQSVVKVADDHDDLEEATTTTILIPTAHLSDATSSSLTMNATRLFPRTLVLISTTMLFGVLVFMIPMSIPSQNKLTTSKIENGGRPSSKWEAKILPISMPPLDINFQPGDEDDNSEYHLDNIFPWIRREHQVSLAKAGLVGHFERASPRMGR